MTENFKFKDSNNDGVPDVVEDLQESIKKSNLFTKTFTKRNMYWAIIIGIILAGYGIFGYMYMNLRNEKIAIQNQFNWYQSEQEIEINKAKMEERRKTINELSANYSFLKDDWNKKRKVVDSHIEKIEDKSFAEETKNEIQQMDINSLRKSFADFGYTPTE